MTRNKQIVHPGSGNTTRARKAWSPCQATVLVSRPGQQSKRNQILKRLRELDEKKLDTSPVDVASEDVFDPPNPASEMDWEDEQVEHHHQIPDKLPMRRKRAISRQMPKSSTMPGRQSYLRLSNLFYYTLVRHLGAQHRPTWISTVHSL